MHDGVYFMIKDDEDLIMESASKVRDIMLECASTIMRNAGDWVSQYKGLEPVPFKVDLEVGQSWGELYGLEI